MKQFNVRLVARTSLTADTDLYRFEVVDDTFSYMPGQFVSFVLTDPLNGGRFVRSYSIAGFRPDAAPGVSVQGTTISSTQFELVIGHVPNGKGSTLLKELPLGSVLKVTGPAGNLILKVPDQEGSPYVFCANATGIAPFRLMLQYLAEAKVYPPIYIFWGLKTAADVYLLDEFAQYRKLWEEHSGKLEVRICLSRESTLPQPPAQMPSCFALGRIQNSLSQLTHSTYQFYICGGKEFVLDVKERLLAQFPESPVYFERFN